MQTFSTDFHFDQIFQAKSIFFTQDDKFQQNNQLNIDFDFDITYSNLSNSNLNEDNNNFHNLPQLNCTQKKKRIFFTNEEDERIKELVEKFGTKKWKIIASFLNNRTARQCRDRYYNYLFPGCFKGQWTNEEDDLLIKLYLQHGSKWAFFANNFPGRTPSALKNRWNYFLSKKVDMNNIIENVDNDSDANKQTENNEFCSIYEESYCNLPELLPITDEYQFLQ